VAQERKSKPAVSGGTRKKELLEKTSIVKRILATKNIRPYAMLTTGALLKSFHPEAIHCQG
jgi:hypothetical protein